MRSFFKKCFIFLGRLKHQPYCTNLHHHFSCWSFHTCSPLLTPKSSASLVEINTIPVGTAAPRSTILESQHDGTKMKISNFSKVPGALFVQQSWPCFPPSMEEEYIFQTKKMAMVAIGPAGNLKALGAEVPKVRGEGHWVHFLRTHPRSLSMFCFAYIRYLQKPFGWTTKSRKHGDHYRYLSLEKTNKNQYST